MDKQQSFCSKLHHCSRLRVCLNEIVNTLLHKNGEEQEKILHNRLLERQKGTFKSKYVIVINQVFYVMSRHFGATLDKNLGGDKAPGGDKKSLFYQHIRHMPDIKRRNRQG